MSRLFAVAGGLLFAGSLLVFVYFYGWRFPDGGAWASSAAWQPALTDCLLFTAFALHHSVFARTPLKSWVQRLAPPGLERSVYVWIASLLLVLVCVWWRPVPGVLWRLNGFPSRLLRLVQLAGAVLSFVAARRLDTLTLAGVRQASGRSPAQEGGPSLDEGGPYALVRHPVYLGWFLMVWAAPTMNGTRLIFAVVSCAYLLLAIPFEERDLCRTFGGAYAAYMKRVRWKVIPRVL